RALCHNLAHFPYHQANRMRNLRVLIIDDEPAIARALRPALEGHDFAVATASSGAEALPQVETFTPDLILLDLGLPDVDGVDLTAELRKQTRVPIIVLSARGADRDKTAALANATAAQRPKTYSNA